MDFGTIPPEINSGHMYSGPGSGSIVESAAAWSQLAAGLHEAATQCREVASSAPCIGWLDAAATQAAHTANLAAAAARAHRSAFAAMVSPEMIMINRARVTSLATTNCLAQACPAIAEFEAEYERMWANDAEAMYTYARASAEASVLTPFSSPLPTADSAAVAHQDSIVSRSSRVLNAAPDVISASHQVLGAIPKALLAMTSAPRTTLDDHLSSVTAPLSQLSSLSAPSDKAIYNLNCLNRAAVLLKTAALAPFPSNQCRDRGAVRAGLGRAASIGALSIPQCWLTDATAGAATAELGGGWVREPIRLVETVRRDSYE
jgi:PPE-repeat protein